MKKALTVLFGAGLLLCTVAAWASDECYTLSGGDYFGGNMTLTLVIQAPSGGGRGLHGLWHWQGLCRQLGPVPWHQPILGPHQGILPPGQRRDQGRQNAVWAVYEYHLSLGPGGSGWTGRYGGEIHTTDGSEKNANGSATEISCN